MILSATGSAEFQHFYPTNTRKVNNFSKIIIKKVLTPKEWGMSLLKEKDYIHPEQKVAVKYNYWDYVNGFNKALLYENANKKHSWFIKICSNGWKLCIFFTEFSIPWILKWNVEVHNTSEGFSCLQRTFYTKFWSKLINKDLDGKVHGQEISVFINDTINKYHVQEISQPQEDTLSPFKKIARKLHMKKGIISRSEAIALYMEEVKKDLLKKSRH
ncbi:hypothetical protein H5410_004798 [Solanum commersonii]|uniref:Uncharacterized protein n=1 Tax=Solanum commersonii TaxID=4109 RepID=A0A9J6A5V0_SOLCO|nr:hypothetical protein H5410_004798 [Solanum commersonii]